jgi:quercetin dioxygenase-like cupin family protein
MAGDGTIVRPSGAGEKRWFFGGGLHTWKATAEETNGAFLVFEDHMEAGKMTPVHVHPDSDEMFYVLEGEIVVHAEGEEHRITAGGFSAALRGVPHAFMTTTECRLLCVQTPGTCQDFFRHASEPTSHNAIDGAVDLARVQAAAAEKGGVVMLGPPPFAAAWASR